MVTPSFEAREAFHLLLLRHLGMRLAGRPYAVKGGACLRFFHHSPRFSQDMDVDVASTVRMDTLQRAVESVLHSRAFLASLISHGIMRIEATAPKQTPTTQRWKVALSLGGETSLPTKVEFSRRHRHLAYAIGVPDGELLTRYRMPPFAAQYYGADEMMAQKILALASGTRYAVRDLFDLHHVRRMGEATLSDVTKLVAPADVSLAIDKARRFTSQDFNQQVLPYLPGTLMDAFRGPRAFETLRSEVEQTLAALGHERR
jgi:predicted nucleotidyltransferase component of viral defense system